MIGEYGKIPDEDPTESYIPTLVKLLLNEEELGDTSQRCSRGDILESFPEQRFLFSFKAKPNLQAVILERDRIENSLLEITGAGGRLSLQHLLPILQEVMNLLFAEHLQESSESHKMIGVKNPALYVLTNWEIGCFTQE